ncbi:GMC oxidoreductase [Jannaschia sp. W003]|uniref:GMC oxidoreductase n=1 Tax=Jannaschia sp. W003 TaxID=2867012 RepID=UPI0021A27E42|nr:GMC family oxidoreductase [Jannaschia sp. W003]UWQ21568.1 GMC family oxidoreductase [Jannaschia sp. W003]
MIVDSRQLPDGQVLDADVCIVGGGPAGITLALELADGPLKVVLLESGGMAYDDATQELYAGPNLGFQYDPLDEARLRFLGGSSNHWAGNCMPLLPIDFERRDWMAHSGWPIGYDDLHDYYMRAQPYLELPTERPYDLAFWAERLGKALLPVDAEQLSNVSVNKSPPTAFGFTYEARLAAARNVSVYLHANVQELETDDAASEVTEVRAACIDGPRFGVRARRFVLCAGGIEIPRLLFLSNRVQQAGLGNGNDLVGRFFADHAAIRPAMRILLARDRAGVDLYTEPSFFPSGGLIGTLASSEALLRREQIGGFVCHLFPGDASPGARSLVNLFRSARRGDVPPYLSSEIGNVLTDLDGAANALFRWSGGDDDVIARDWLAPWLTIESVPNPDSRVRLVDERDRFGQRRIGLDWQLTETEMRTVRRATEILAGEVGRMGLGRSWTEVLRDDYAWPDYVARGKHHCGTTRMSDDPATGVVDADCRVHGVRNLFVGSSSVFPTHGYANPTLTIVALSIRMADLFREDAGRGRL